MANIFKSIGQLFGLSSGDKSQSQGYSGTTPFMSLKEIPEEDYTINQIMSRLKANQYGLPQSMLDATTNPYAASVRQGLKDYTYPSIYNALSSRGLGKSSLVGSQVAQKGLESEQDIANKIANLQLQNEQYKYGQMTGDESTLQNYATNEAQQKTTRANFDYNDYLRVMGARANQNQQDLAGAGNLLGLASTVAGGAIGYGMGGMPGAMAGMNIGSSVFGGGGYNGLNTSDLTSLVSLLSGKNASIVNKGTSNIENNSFALQGLNFS